MAKLTINRGTVANDGTGDNLRAGANKVNLNFDEIYTALGDGTTLDGTIKVADDSSTVSTLSANGETLRILGGNAITTTISGNDLTIAADTASLLTFDGVATLSNKDLTDASNTFPTISIKDDASTIDTVNLGQTITFEGGAGITTTVTDNKVSYAADVSATSTTTLTNKTINGPDNTLTNIANGSLANSSITLGDDAISLGGTQTTVTNLSLDGATGTIDLTSQANKIRFNYNGTGNFPTAATYEGMFAYDYAGNEAYVADAGGWVKLINENASIADISNVSSIASISAGQGLVWNAGGYFEPGAVGGGDVVTDTTPQLGGDLDAQTNHITDVAYLAHRSPDWTVTRTLVVTVATKTAEHYRFGQGSANGYVIDGVESPLLELSPGVYKFDQSDASNSGHPLAFYYDQDKNRTYTTNVVTSGTAGSAGAHTTISIEGSTVTPLEYQCTAHSYMGHQMIVPAGRQSRLNITSATATGDLSGANSGKSFTILANMSVNDILVFVNGICMVPTDDYTVSGTTLTFDTAPATGAEIQFRYLGA